ncbi:peptidyl-prolyl cis-trans isomerase-like [Mizuhopecten yessoensis]|uniref:Peptidyl-prolyl cis-trans isomerase n=1 Tax=Mizuhopecten yessoensis TaxID=6573 RepID=A0A210QZ62_MIZYE|nr:peptidyl-prolyl cis-trans isomerase-like [Mizuhopecten yessoensis]OWF54073.1 Peptidyl-prolyl cis-trans isomerase B [Mizuhopecten yessoensis]
MANSCLLLFFVYCAIVSISEADKTATYTKKNVPHVVTEEVWFDVLIKDYEDGEDYHGRFVIALFGEVVPMTTLNFLSLAKGVKRPNIRKQLHYKDTPIHRIVQDFVIQMGDVVNGDGTGGESIYGSMFVDENFDLSHQAAGYVSMANTGTDSNSSQFFIVVNRARWLDGKHVVFGKVVRGMDVVRKVSNLELKKNSATSKKTVFIEDCGVVGIPEKYELTPAEIRSNEDL